MQAIEMVTESKTWRAVQSLVQDCLPASSAQLVDTANGGTFPISAFRINVGRGSDNNCVLADEEASRRHLSITFDSGRFYIEDLDSTNGTLLNGKFVCRRERLINGDIIRVGRTVFRFKTEASFVRPPAFALAHS